MNRAQLKNKITQMIYKPTTKSDNADPAFKGLKELDTDIEKAVNELFGVKKKKKSGKKSDDKDKK